MRKICAFTAKTPDHCVKCAQPIVPGQEIGWLRDADRKGYFHVECASLPTQEALTLVRVDDPKAREGYRYVRVQDLKGHAALLPEHPVEKRLTLREAMQEAGADLPLPGPWKVREPNADGIMVTKETLASLVAQAVAQLPRIQVTIVVHAEEDAEPALELLSKELFARKGVMTI